MRNPAESNKSAYGIDRHIRAAMPDKINAELAV